MADGRSRIILTSIAVAESLWVFALVSSIGLIVELGGSPLPWVTMLAVLAVAIITGHVLAGSEGDPVTFAIWQAVIGVIAIYLLLGTGAFVTGGMFDIGWLLHLLEGEFEQTGAVSAIFGVIIAVWLWRYGLKLSTERYPEDRLSRIFKLGIGVLAAATLIDQARDGEIGASALFLPFFAATLVGLAVGRLPESGDGRSASQWAKIIAISVFGVMSGGLLIGLVGGLYGRGGVRLLYAGWEALVDGFLWLLQWPLIWIVNFFTWLFNLLGVEEPSGTRQEQEGEQLSGRDIFGADGETVSQTGNATADLILEIIKYPLIALIIVAAFFALAMAFRRLNQRDSSDDSDERESIRGDADAADDMARLLSMLTPGWLRGKNKKVWRSPDGQGIAEVFRLYFETLAMGIKWGMKFDPQMTPAERLPALEAALPGAPVREVTERFNAACYGQSPSPPARVAELSESMREAERQLRRH